MKLVPNELFYKRTIKNLLKIFFYYFWTQSQKVPEATFKIVKYVQNFFSLAVQKFFSLALHHLTIFDPLIQKDFWVFPKIKVSNQCCTQRFYVYTLTCKASGLRETVTHTVAPY